MSFAWDARFSIGVENIDAGHRMLFARVNRLLAAMGSDRRDDEVRGLVSFLEEHVIAQFRAEEDLMQQYGYPGFAAHKVAHVQFAALVTELRRELDRRGPTSLLAMEINHHVCGWVIDHIRRLDRDAGVFLTGKTASA